MQLWTEWWKVVACLRPACSRARSFMWLVVALAGFSVRSDLLGVTRIVRGLGLKRERKTTPRASVLPNEA